MTKIQEILNVGWEEYKREKGVPTYKIKVVEAIKNCKTEKMGAHLLKCDECGYEKPVYNSCRNRHCPNCQAGKKLEWIDDRKKEVLNIKYYHIVNTIPSELYSIAYQNPEKIYKLMFKCASETLKELSEDKKYLGAEIGFFGILHTWGQNIAYHPHIHMVVTGGGLDKLGKWIEKDDDFFIPVKVISKKFKCKFLSLIRKEKLEFYGDNKYLEDPYNFNIFINKLYNKEWISYCKEPFKSAKHVIDYLGKYTHRVAISNYRIIKVENGQVTFKYKDYKNNDEIKLMTISIKEFIRRFLFHILPYKFMKIRYYGLLGSRNKAKKLLKCKILTRTKIIKEIKETKVEKLRRILGKKFNCCPKCKKGHLILENTT